MGIGQLFSRDTGKPMEVGERGFRKATLSPDAREIYAQVGISSKTYWQCSLFSKPRALNESYVGRVNMFVTNQNGNTVFSLRQSKYEFQKSEKGVYVAFAEVIIATSDFLDAMKDDNPLLKTRLECMDGTPFDEKMIGKIQDFSQGKIEIPQLGFCLSG